MSQNSNLLAIEDIKKNYPNKFLPDIQLFKMIKSGNTVFIGTGCGEPVQLVKLLISYLNKEPKSFFDVEVIQLITLGAVSYADDKFRDNFRPNAFFVGGGLREAVNKGLADYTPIFLSNLPSLFEKKIVPIDVALIQTSYPDRHGYVSLGISVDIVKTVVENAKIVIAQLNSYMPRVHGECFFHLDDIHYLYDYSEPLLEYRDTAPPQVSERIGELVSKIVRDGDTIQIGYGGIPNAILKHLKDKKNLGVHTELLTDGIVELMKSGVIDNSKKTLNRGKTVASFCMGTKDTYDFLHDNPAFEFRPISYTNNPLNIARNANMTAINSALEIDLTGQATAESLGKLFYSGVGGQADFMRGANFSQGGKTILVMKSTTKNDEVSKIVPFLTEGAGVTLTRGDIHYVVTEYGIAYLHGKNIRERAMDLISIAHPKFRPWLIEEAKKQNLIYKDQIYVSKGDYPYFYETYRTTKTDLNLLLRPVRLNDEPILKDFFYSLSEDSLFKRFICVKKEMPHQELQFYTAIDYTKEMVILAIVQDGWKETVVGVGQYSLNEKTLMAEVAFLVRDDYQKQGVGEVLLNYLTYIAKRAGLYGFTAEVLVDNKPMLKLFEKMGFKMERKRVEEVYLLKMFF
ncbi:MAG: GNAT family N-acetyltransferase [Proteobacteria bacterium]|nr:GNAT family N-acetyltransferase [Pseudomonadota bacterium]